MYSVTYTTSWGERIIREFYNPIDYRKYMYKLFALRRKNAGIVIHSYSFIPK